MRKIAFLYLLLCLVSSVEAGAQFARIYSSDTGLPSNQVNCVFQDREGYIWFATQEGLARFNGMDFETFRNEGVMSFFEDSKGTKWVGTAVGLRMFDAVNGTFLPVPAVQQDDPAVPLYIADVIEASTSSGIDDILFATSSSGVFVLNAETRELNKKKMDVINAQLASPYLSKHAAQAAEIARKAKVKQLIIGHISARYADYTPLLEEAKAIFENTILAEEKTSYWF